MRCRIHQWRAGRALAAGEEMPPAVARHVAGCEPCRRHCRQLQVVADRLRAGVPDLPAMPEELTQRILSAARSAGRPARPTPARALALRLRGRWIGYAALAAAACILAAVAAFLLWPAGPDSNGGMEIVAPPPPAPPRPAVFLSAETLTGGLWPGVRDAAATPIRQELDRVAADTRQLSSAILSPLTLGLLRPSDEPPPPPRDKAPGASDDAPPPRGTRAPRPPDVPKPSGAAPAGWHWLLLLGSIG